MEFEDTWLVARCLQGDTEAYGELVTRYEGAVYATAFYYVGRYGEAEDVAQDAFLEAYKNLRKLKDHSRFAPWLREITCRTAANWLRRHGKRISNETPLPFRRKLSIEQARQQPDGIVERHERVDRVQDAIDSLPERYRLPVVLRYLQELSYEEIGDFIGESVEEVRGVLQRAGRLLRDQLADLDSAGEDEGQWHRVRE